MNTQTGSYITLGGIIATILSHFGVSSSVDDVAAVLGGIAIIYGWIHQYVVTRKVVNLAKTAGAVGLK